jgi:tetratricopeptide (TPR) repeat protein
VIGFFPVDETNRPIKRRSKKESTMKKLLVGLISCLLFLNGTAWSKDAMDYYNLGLNSSMANRKINYFTRAIEINPALPHVYDKRGMLYYYQGKYTEAIQDFQRVAHLKPLESGTYVMLGRAYLEEEDYDQAIAHLTRAIELNPQMPDAYSYISEAYRLKGMIAEAILQSAKAIEFGGVEPVIGRAYSTRAKAYRSLGEVERADEDFNKALRLDPEHYKYTLFTVTEYLADSASESSSLKGVGRTGLFMMCVLFFVAIFKLVLPPPQKPHQKRDEKDDK